MGEKPVEFHQIAAAPTHHEHKGYLTRRSGSYISHIYTHNPYFKRILHYSLEFRRFNNKFGKGYNMQVITQNLPNLIDF